MNDDELDDLNKLVFIGIMSFLMGMSFVAVLYCVFGV